MHGRAFVGAPAVCPHGAWTSRIMNQPMGRLTWRVVVSPSLLAFVMLAKTRDEV